jgi:hypothetical protein
METSASISAYAKQGHLYVAEFGPSVKVERFFVSV